MFTMLEPRTQIKKLGLEQFVNCLFVNGIPNSEYHWIKCNNGTKSFGEVEIVRYQCILKKDHYKPEEPNCSTKTMRL